MRNGDFSEINRAIYNPLTGQPFSGNVIPSTQFDPAAVKLPESRQVLLQSLGKRADFSAGIVSGRRISDLRDRVSGGSSMFYAGLHGLEIEGPGLRYVHPGVALAAPDRAVAGIRRVPTSGGRCARTRRSCAVRSGSESSDPRSRSCRSSWSPSLAFSTPKTGYGYVKSWLLA